MRFEDFVCCGLLPVLMPSSGKDTDLQIRCGCIYMSSYAYVYV